ncbi:spermidine hydroxycinnamoyl transferase-like [Phaseolus vulgaris]|uniref:Spermidine hydroxycinnamoyl transferase n=1 Tax=Phaseolus vulgaris TaxID=3885 RepID=V7BMV9_PHAVU|nr:hypothetical protein PHAVU_006G036800g [Phaseolus vulgaris]ESW18390.1 hypothetical protein PHAVU_006G036800g [Phaseolus vulgaris]
MPSTNKMVTIVASHNITPNQPTPNDPLWLSDSDQIGNLRHVSCVYIYKAKHNKHVTERLRNSLSKTLVHYYPVAGRLRLTKSGRMEVNCNAKGVTLLDAHTTNSFADYGDFSPSLSTEQLVPKVDYTQPIEDIPLMLMQITGFHGGEGLAIGIVTSHPLTDATSMMPFVNNWAKVARGEELDPNEIPFLDRVVLKLPQQPSSPSVKLPEWKPVSQAQGIEQGQRSAALFKLSSRQVEILKKKANNDKASNEGVRPYSRFEVIAAHIWRCASKARASAENSNQPTLVRFSVDIRSRLNPPLPKNYFGNALAKTVTPKCYEGDIISNPLRYAAQKIREAVYVVTDEYIRAQLSVILGQEQLDSISAFFMGQGHRVNVPYAGNHNILLTSWMGMPVYEADFGWGKPVHYGLATTFEEDRAAILPSSDGDGVAVTIFFQTALMELFKILFYEDLFLSSL